MGIMTFEDLACPFCPSIRFVRIIRLRYHPNSGIQDIPDGLRCADCQMELDQTKMLDVHLFNKKKKELEEQQKELEANAPPQPKAKAATVGVKEAPKHAG